MKEAIKVGVAEVSEVIRRGIASMLPKLNHHPIEITEISDAKELKQYLVNNRIDILIVNPLLMGFTSLNSIRKMAQNQQMKFIALQTTLVAKASLQEYDVLVSIYDSMKQIKETFTKIIITPDSEKHSEALSVREREILSLVVKGMSNKQIADKLFLSVHTVVTHRRNICNKLDIHNTSGLIIYAIVNGLVEIGQQ